MISKDHRVLWNSTINNSGLDLPVVHLWWWEEPVWSECLNASMTSEQSFAVVWADSLVPRWAGSCQKLHLGTFKWTTMSWEPGVLPASERQGAASDWLVISTMSSLGKIQASKWFLEVSEAKPLDSNVLLIWATAEGSKPSLWYRLRSSKSAALKQL